MQGGAGARESRMLEIWGAEYDEGRSNGKEVRVARIDDRLI